MKICVISTDKKYYAPRRIIEEGKKRQHAMYFMNWKDICLDISPKKIYIGDRKMSLNNFQAIIPRSDSHPIIINNKKNRRDLDTIFRLVIEYAKSKNVVFLNNLYFSEYQSLDKLTQQFFFFQNKLPGISSYYFPSAQKMVKDKKILDFPLVAKSARGSQGKGVFKINNTSEINKFIKTRINKKQFFLFQKYHPINFDYRVLVVGGKVLGIMRRRAVKGEWRTNFSLGGQVERCEREKAIEKLAINTAKKMGFDYVGIDILKDRGKLHIIETNSLPQFKGFETAFPEINVARELIKIIERKVKES